MKYDWKFKLDCVLKYKEGRRDFAPKDIDRASFFSHVREWAKAYDDLGVDGLKHSPSNKGWTAEQRLELVAKVLAGDSITSVARSHHLSSGQLCQWVRRYREKGWMV